MSTEIATGPGMYPTVSQPCALHRLTSAASDVFIIAVLDCISGTLGFVNYLIILVSSSKIDVFTGTTSPPSKAILGLLLAVLRVSCGVVGVQAFNTLQPPTARLLYLLQLVSYICSLLQGIVDIILSDESITVSLTSFILLTLCFWGYIVYIEWSFYKRLLESSPVPDSSLGFSPRNQPVHEVVNIQNLSGFVAEARGHCPECFQVPGVNAERCSACADWAATHSSELPEVVTGIPFQ
ncbi:hypothetical protein CYMTET_38388, partial [Cymbomonas tetramitiformis]